MKPRHLLLGGALAVAAGLVLFGDRTPAGEVVEPVARPAAAAPPAAKASRGTPPAAEILRLQPRESLIRSQDDAPGAGVADAFGSRNWDPPPPPPPPAPPPPVPTAPALPFTYIGKALEEGTWEVYLARGDRTYVVRDKDVVEGSYRVESIKPPLMLLTYLPLGQVQQLNIGVFE